jgi:PAS domain S-box-containing protein
MSKPRSGGDTTKRTDTEQAQRRRGELLRSRDIAERKRVEQELHESEERYRNLVEAAPDVIYTVSAEDGSLTSLNPAFETLTGWSRAEWLGKSFVGIVHPDDLPVAVEAFQKVSRGETQRPSECRVLCKSGEYLVGEFTLTPVVRNGRVVAGLGIARDVTERKRVEEDLRVSEARFRTLSDAAPAAIFVYQGNKFRYVNPAAEVITGHSQNELLKKNFWDLAHPDVRDLIRERSLARQRGELVPTPYEFKIMTKAGEERWLDFTDGKFELEGNPAIMVAFDVTERKRAQEALRESEARFRAIFENAAIGIALVDVHGHPVESNPALQKMVGYDKFELADMAFTEFTHPDDARADWDLFIELVEGKHDHYQMEKRFLRRDGQVVWGQLSVSLVRNEKGEFKYCVGMVEDISERKRAEESMRRLSGRLLRLQDEERRRIARQLHETVGQSLAGLAINLTVVKDSAADLSPRASACLSESLELAEQCSREIRTLSYLLHPPLVDEAGLDPALRWYTAGFAQRSGIEVHVDVSPGFGRLPSEFELTLYRIVQEALTNIHRHSGSKTARISLERRPNEIVLTVEDEGRGFSSAALGIAGPESADIGVGIPGMRERLRQLGGRLHIQSSSRGTTLTAILPSGR